MKLKDISRTATFAWDQSSSASPLLATGAAAGALDESFSNESQLEIWAPDFGESQGMYLGGQESKPHGSITVNSRFNRLAWSTPTSTASRGVLAAGMETGEINVFDPEKIINGVTVDEARLFTNNKHTGPVRGLDFNPIQKNLMLSGAVNAELYIFDLNNPTNPIPPGTLSTKLGEITAVQWNSTVSRIFAASSSSGFTSVWDLRTQKEIASLQYGGGAAKGMGTVGGVAGLQMGKRRGMSDVCWHPEQATQLITASEDDESPIIMLWDLRNTRAPERILSGHTKGVLSVSWCKQDSDLLVSCGKDNRTLCWNPQTGDIIGELPASSDWSFQTAWCPRNPDLLATASFDGHIGIHSLQTTHVPEQAAPQFGSSATADDIFAGLGQQEPSDQNANVLSLNQPPKWLRRPVSATFGFGGLLASTSNLPAANGKHQSGVVHLRNVVTEQTVIDRAQSLEGNAGDKEKLEAFCNGNVQDAAWKTLQTLFKANSRDELVQLLGFSKEDVARQVQEAIQKYPSLTEPIADGATTPKAESVKAESIKAESVKAESVSAESSKDETQSSLFPEESGGADFFSSMASGGLKNHLLENVIPHKSDAAASSVAVTVGGSRASSLRSEVVKDNIFHIYPSGENDVDRLVTRALVLGDFDSAVNLCLASERFADALLLAVRGGPELLQSTQKAYFAKRTTSVPFLRVFQSIVTEDLADIVQNADLGEWKVIFIVLCTFAKDGEFNNLADQLGQRLQYRWQLFSASDSPENKSAAKEARENATLCFLAARKLEKVVGIWTEELREEEQSSSAARYTAHAQALQSFIEKVSVFTAATGYIDEDLATPTESAAAAEAGVRTYKLASLYDRYYEYADLLATQGLVDIAAKYVQKTPADYKGTGGAASDFDKARERLLKAASVQDAQTRPPVPSASRAYAPVAPLTSGPSTSSYTAPPSTYAPQTSTYAPSTSYQPAQPAPAPQPQQQSYGYGGNSYAPTQPYQNAAYTPSGYGADPQPQGYGANSYAAPPQPLAPPPRAGQITNGSTSTPPPIPAAQRRDMPGWNDAPSLAPPKRPTSAARETPKPAPIMSPFPNATVESSGPSFAPSNYGSTPPPRASQPGVLPPPPKGGPRPPSAQAIARNVAAPPGPPQGGPSYGPPPTQLAPPQPAGPPPGPPRGPPRGGPPPGVLAGPPPRALSPLGPQGRTTPLTAALQGGPRPPSRNQSAVAPAQSPPVASPPPPAAPAAPAAPVKPTHPAGDRSHIPETSKPIYQSLSTELQRVKQSDLPANIKRIVDDTERRMNILFDQLNNDSIPKPVLGQLGDISKAIAAKDSNGALALHVQLLTNATGEMTAWVTGVKQLIRLGV